MTGRTKRPKLAVATRWMIQTDLPRVLEIENSSFDHRWDEADFRRVLRSRSAIGTVAELPPSEPGDCTPLVGFMVYELHTGWLEILNLAVDWRHRRGGVGSFLVERVIDKLSAHRRKYCSATVRETNLLAQYFFRSLRFEAVQVRRGHYPDTGEDGYRFEFRV